MADQNLHKQLPLVLGDGLLLRWATPANNDQDDMPGEMK